MRCLTSNQLSALGLAASLALGGPAAAEDAGAETATASALPNPGQAALFSLVLPGSGQIWAGEPIRGGLFLGAAAGFSAMAVAGYFLKNDAFLQTAGTGLLLLSVVAPVDAYLMVRDRNLERTDPARGARGTTNPR